MQIQKLLRASGQIMKLVVSAYRFYGGIIIIKQSDVQSVRDNRSALPGHNGPPTSSLVKSTEG